MIVLRDDDRSSKMSFKRHLEDLERIKKEETDVIREISRYDNGKIPRLGQLIGELRTEGVPDRSKSEIRAPRATSLKSEEESRDFDMSKVRINL